MRSLFAKLNWILLVKEESSPHFNQFNLNLSESQSITIIIYPRQTRRLERTRIILLRGHCPLHCCPRQWSSSNYLAACLDWNELKTRIFQNNYVIHEQRSHATVPHFLRTVQSPKMRRFSRPVRYTYVSIIGLIGRGGVGQRSILPLLSWRVIGHNLSCLGLDGTIICCVQLSTLVGYSLRYCLCVSFFIATLYYSFLSG